MDKIIVCYSIILERNKFIPYIKQLYAMWYLNKDYKDVLWDIIWLRKYLMFWALVFFLSCIDIIIEVMD